MPTKLLALGDLHLGRRPRRLPPALEERCSPAHAWERCVDLALQERVQALLLAGDVVDDERDRFEALALLSQGAARLHAAGIPVIAVAGNHDGFALPALCDRVPGVRLLGRNAAWELHSLTPDLEVLGWSFPANHHTSCPTHAPGLDSLPPRTPGRARIALLHADLGAQQSAYAPLQRSVAEALPVDALLLGHLHQPDALHTQGRPLGYLGSVVGLDRTETGAHGPWLIHAHEGELSLEQRRLGPLQWEALALDLPDDGFHRADDLHEWLQQQIIAELCRFDTPVEVLALSLRLRGRPRRPIGPLLAQLAPDHLGSSTPSVVGVVVHVEDATLPAIDLDVLCAQQGPLGLAAKLTRQLELGEPLPPELQGLLERALAPLQQGRWALSGHPPLASHPIGLTAARRLLHQLISQRDPC